MKKISFNKVASSFQPLSLQEMSEIIGGDLVPGVNPAGWYWNPNSDNNSTIYWDGVSEIPGDYQPEQDPRYCY